MSELVSPDALEADAVVPQCLDNQYVSDEVFHDMIERGVDYEDRGVAAARERAFRTEFIRSLVYSSQVVIQRAYLKNSDFLYQNYRPENREDFSAFADLMRQHAIVPFLFRESSLTDELDFDLRREGDAVAKALVDEVGDEVRCVRLDLNDERNANAATGMETNFSVGLVRLRFLPVLQRNAMASELFADPARLQQEGEWEAFSKAVNQLADYSYSTGGKKLSETNKPLTRQDVYRDRFAAGETEHRNNNVVLGRFKAPEGDNRFLLELKKYVDLVYNVNLPDHLGRYTFTPSNMPSRMALQDVSGEGFSHGQISAIVSNDEALDWIRRSFVARTQAAMDLPLLSELSVADVLAIRRLPEWDAFKNAQSLILKNPLRCLDNLPAFEKSFDEFQRALSRWYNETYKRQQTVARYSSVVTLALSIAGVLVVAGSNLGPIPHDSADIILPALASALPRKVKGYAAKLMVGVYDLEQHQLDSDRGYTIEMMQTNEELLREDVVDLLNSITRSRELAVPALTEPVADQGIR